MGYSKEELEKQKQERIGEENCNLYGTLMRIIEYNDSKDIIVEFQDKYKVKVHTGYGNFKKGEVKNPYDKTVHGVGYIGEGKYKVSINGKNTIAYKVWFSMIQRCYDPYYLDKHPTYRDCIVCKEWHCFQNFTQWYEENYYECNDEQMELDKDILIKGNKIYSPETCIFVPHRINSLFTKSNAKRGNCLIGVCFHKRDRIYESNCSVLDKKGSKRGIYLGRFKNEIDAFIAYKQFKENYIKQVADEYKKLIPTKLYEALYKYEVKIND